MSLLTVERIKLASTRSPWWCAAIAVGLSIGLTVLISFGSKSTGRNGETFAMGLRETIVGGAQFGLAVIMIMATLAVTTEYRFGIIRTTFQAAPNRTAVVLTKALLLAVVSAVLALMIAFASVLLARLISGAELPVSSAADWRTTAGLALVYALAAVLAVAVGTLLRQSAGAIALLLLFPLVVENLVQLIPNVGADIYKWMPFVNADNFLGTASGKDLLGPWSSLGYFAAVVVAVLAVALVVVNRRDA